MATPIAISLGTLNIGTAPYTPQEPVQWGSDAVQAALLTGDYRPEEMDQAALELNLVRQVSIPMSIRSTSADQSLADQQAITQLLAQANRLAPLGMTVQPTNSSKVSTFQVWGGSWSADYTNYSSLSNVVDGTLNLQTDPFIYGSVQSLGSAGAPLGTAVATPATVTLTPAVSGDIPSNVTVFVKNRAASTAARSLMVGCVSGNTSWTPLVDSSTWTPGADGTRDTSDATTKNTDLIKGPTVVNADQVYQIANWAAPTLPTDRLFTVWLRMADPTTTNRGTYLFRLRHVCGAVEVIGGWRSVPLEASANAWVGAKMGSWPFPPGQISTAGAAATTTFLEVLATQSVSSIAAIKFDFALYLPTDSSITFETGDTTKTLVAAAATVQVENDQVFSTAGVPAAGIAIGNHVRSYGTTRYCVHLSQGYLGPLDSAIYWDFQPVDVYAQVTPRFLGLVDG